MSEFEMATLFLTFYNSALSYFELYMTALSAVLVVGYLVGSKLTSTMVAVIMMLFTMVTLVCIWHIVGAYNESTTIALEIAKLQTSPDPKLTWMFKDNPPTNIIYIVRILTAAMVIAYIATIVFFFHARKQLK